MSLEQNSTNNTVETQKPEQNLDESIFVYVTVPETKANNLPPITPKPEVKKWPVTSVKSNYYNHTNINSQTQKIPTRSPSSPYDTAFFSFRDFVSLFFFGCIFLFLVFCLKGCGV